MDRDEYNVELRSTISTEFDEGKRKRRLVFEEYGRYSAYKAQHGVIDEHDLVLQMIEKIRKRIGDAEEYELFQALYLDEVQDFTFAFLYLVAR